MTASRIRVLVIVGVALLGVSVAAWLSLLFVLSLPIVEYHTAPRDARIHGSTLVVDFHKARGRGWPAAVLVVTPPVLPLGDVKEVHSVSYCGFFEGESLVGCYPPEVIAAAVDPRATPFRVPVGQVCPWRLQERWRAIRVSVGPLDRSTLDRLRSGSLRIIAATPYDGLPGVVPGPWWAVPLTR